MSDFVRIDEKVAQTYGSIKIAYLIARNIQVTTTPPREKKIARRVEANVRSSYSLTNLQEDSVIDGWMRLARRMNISNDDELPAQIQLLRRILSGYDIPKINNVVDAANITAAKFRCPVGAFDLEKLEGGVTLRLAQVGDVMKPLFSDSEVNLPEGEIIYADEHKVFSRYCKDADHTKITEFTKNIFCVVDGTSETPSQHIVEARDSLASILREVGGDEVFIEEDLKIGQV